MNKLKFIKEKVYTACPELKELRQGCKIKVRWVDEINIHTVFQHDGCETFYFDERSSRDNGDMTIIEDNITGDIVKIIGQDITLLDILRTFPSIGLQRGEEFDQGRWILLNEEPTGVKWELDKSLEKQSKELKKFLIDLIVKK